MADSAYQKGQLYQLDLALLQADPNQPRKVMDPQALEDMIASITKLGVIQPIIFRTDPGIQGHDPYSSESGIGGHDPYSSESGIGGHDPYSSESGIVSPNSDPAATAPNLFIVAGERRVTAARQVGLATIPAICIVDGNYAEVALVENLLRQDLTAVEEAEALQRLMTDQQYTQEQLGVIVGKARTTVGDILTLNKLPQAIRDECRGDRQISRTTLIEIARKKQERSMITAFNAYKAKQQKGKTSRQKTVETPGVIIDWVSKTTAKLETFNAKLISENCEDWKEEDRISYQTALTALKTEIDRYLSIP